MEQLRAARVTVREVAAGPHGVDLAAVLAQLRQSGIESLMVEGGRRVITSLFATGQVNRLVVSISLTIIGARCFATPRVEPAPIAAGGRRLLRRLRRAG